MERVDRPRVLGPRWDSAGFRQLGWKLMPLRLFLGVTFLYASLQKLANPSYFRASSPSSVVAQMKALEASSPIGPLLRLSLHAPTLVGLLIALGELAVSLGILTGLWTRLAALGGMLLSLTFFLTVSWSTTPYYYGSDIVFVFAWTVFVTCGAGGVLSVDAWIEARADTGAGWSQRPVDQVRRRILVGARSTALLAAIAGVLGGATAIIGRAAGASRSASPPALPPTQSSTARQSHPSRTGRSGRDRHARHGAANHSSATQSTNQPAAGQPSGTALTAVSAVPVGQGRRFTDPASGHPGWLLRPRSSTVLAFSAVCTHAGCTVGFDSGANEFVCPCHGGRYSATTGAVLGGPPPAPLSRIPARIVNNEIRVD